MIKTMIAITLVLLALTASSCAKLTLSTKAPRPYSPQMTDEREGVWQNAIAASGNAVHLVWGTATELLYRQSNDEGLTWSEDLPLASYGELHLTDPIVASGNHVYVVYLRKLHTARDWCCERTLGDIYLRRSVDGGVTWESEQRLTRGAGAFRLSMAATDRRVDLVWSDFRSGKWEIYYLRSRDAGVTWDSERQIVQAWDNETNRPQVASDGNAVHVVWMDDRDKNPPCYTMRQCPEVYYIRSIDGGDTWGAQTRLTSDQPFSGRPDIAALSGTVLVSYDEDSDGNESHEQHLLRSTDGGNTWEPSLRLSNAPGPSDHSSLIASGGMAHLAWHDQRDSGTGEIYYRYSTDRGATWSPEENVSKSGGHSGIPLLAATTHYLHIIWLDDRTGKFQIRYDRRVFR